MHKIIFTTFLVLLSFQNLFSEEYFLTLRNKVNLRQGPSFEYPIKLFYKKVFTRIDSRKIENFRKIRDMKNNSGWVHISQLSKETAITIDDNLIVFNRPSLYSQPKVILKKGKLCKIKKCKDEWCKIASENFKGWVKKDSLWGRLN